MALGKCFPAFRFLTCCLGGCLRHVYTYIYIHIYIERERGTCTYVYKYICVCLQYVRTDIHILEGGSCLSWRMSISGVEDHASRVNAPAALSVRSPLACC